MPHCDIDGEYGNGRIHARICSASLTCYNFNAMQKCFNRVFGERSNFCRKDVIAAGNEYHYYVYNSLSIALSPLTTCWYISETIEKSDMLHMREFLESGGRTLLFDERRNALISILPPDIRRDALMGIHVTELGAHVV